MKLVEVQRGDSPVVLAFPHTGTILPPLIRARLNENGCLLADTDWHLHRLYEDLLPTATVVRATFHRYVIDANRDPAGTSLYPGQNTTELVPTTDFDGLPIWRECEEPTTQETAERLTVCHAHYHEELAAEVARVRTRHGVAVLYDCHSIRSRIPFLFPGTLPDFNIGTGADRRPDGAPGTCDPAIEAAAVETTGAAAPFTSVLNGRFKGGWTTRHYGRPVEGVHAIQMELAQSNYLASESPPFAYDEMKAETIRGHLRKLLSRIEGIAFDL